MNGHTNLYLKENMKHILVITAMKRNKEYVTVNSIDSVANLTLRGGSLFGSLEVII